MREFDILILLATYNGSKYLRAQLNSLIYQKTTLNFQIIISDDLSTDDTIDILKEYENKYSFIKVIVKNIALLKSLLIIQVDMGRWKILHI